MIFWNKKIERNIFTEAMKNFASPEQLFYKLTDGHFAYIPNGFQTFEQYQKLTDYIEEVVNSDMNFFSSMLQKKKLGQIITISSKEKDDISKAEKFLNMING